MDKKKVIETLFDKKVIKILRLFINNPDNDYYLREIARISKVSPTSTFRILSSMKDLDLLLEKKDKHLKTYSLIQENAGMFIDLLGDKKSAIQEFAEFIKTVGGVKSCMLHGKEEKDKASILIVGEGVNQEKIRSQTLLIKEKYDFNIIFLVMDPMQYEQMLQMGLYPGKKTTLYEF
jgi:hypothetical protein